MSKLPVKPVLLLAVAAACGALLAPAEEGGASMVQPRRDAWLMPDLPRKPDLVGQGLAMVTSPIFEPEAQIAAAAAAAAKPPEDLRWRIAGLFRRGNDSSVLISFMAPGKASQTLRVGERLPTGHRITKIDGNEVCVQLGKKSYRLGVESRE